MLPTPHKIRKNSLFFLFVYFFLACTLTQAAQEVIDKKETRSGKEALNAGIAKSSQKSLSENKEEDYIYDPRGKTDPFKSFIVLQEEREESTKRTPTTYLETVELSQLQLTVVVVNKKGSWAMVRDSKGEGHVIKEGAYIGTKGGVVHRITDGEVLVREEYRDFRGDIKYREKPLKMPSVL